MKSSYEYVILGAGPTGLTIASKLIQGGVPREEVLVLEKEIEAGGLCRSVDVDGFPLDIGGGHFLDNRNTVATNFLFEFLPEGEWNSFTRDSKIEIGSSLVDYPLEANLWQLPIDQQIDYLEAIARAGCVTDETMPENFEAWVRWKFGEKIASDYMLPYNRKIWSMDLDLLGIYWLYKLPDVSFRETLKSCLLNKPQGTLPAHGTFLYPKSYGYGEVWSRIGSSLGSSLRLGFDINSINLATLEINSSFNAGKIISTIPWRAWDSFSELPYEVLQDIDRLKHVSIDVTYHPETLDSASHWVYLPDEALAEHRKLIRSNFVEGAPGYWTETNSVRKLHNDLPFFHNEYAYPVNTIDKPAAIERITKWADTKGLVAAGRWGTWEHMNSDIAVSKAIDIARGILEDRNNENAS